MAETHRNVSKINNLFMLQTKLQSGFNIRKTKVNGNSLLILSNIQKSRKSRINNLPVYEWVINAKNKHLKVTEKCKLESEKCTRRHVLGNNNFCSVLMLK